MKNQYKKIILFCPRTGTPAAVSVAEAAAITGRSLRTAQRWARTQDIEPPSLRLLHIHAFGWLPWPQWDGWRVRGSTLYHEADHNSYWWDSERLRAWWLQVQQLQHYRREYERLSGKKAPRLVPVFTDTKRPA